MRWLLGTAAVLYCRACTAPFMFILQLMVPANPPIRCALLRPAASCRFDLHVSPF